MKISDRSKQVLFVLFIPIPFSIILGFCFGKFIAKIDNIQLNLEEIHRRNVTMLDDVKKMNDDAEAAHKQLLEIKSSLREIKSPDGG